MDQSLFKFDLIAEDPTTHARAGVLHTPHGDIETPIFLSLIHISATRARSTRPSMRPATCRCRPTLPITRAIPRSTRPSMP